MNYQNQKYIVVVIDYETGISDHIEYTNNKTKARSFVNSLKGKETNNNLTYELWNNPYYQEVQ